MAARTIGLALAICGVGCSSAAPSRSAVAPSDRLGPRVYVDTPPTGSAAERSARQQSVADVRAALGKAHGRLVLVDSPTEADITVAIIERVIADSGSSFSLFPPRYYAARSIVRLRATVTRAGESADLTGSRWRESDAQGWLSAAQDIATAIEAWNPCTSLFAPAGPSASLVPWPAAGEVRVRPQSPIGSRRLSRGTLDGPMQIAVRLQVPRT